MYERIFLRMHSEEIIQIIQIIRIIQMIWKSLRNLRNYQCYQNLRELLICQPEIFMALPILVLFNI